MLAGTVIESDNRIYAQDTAAGLYNDVLRMLIVAGAKGSI